jgi:hypothetical protein
MKTVNDDIIIYIADVLKEKSESLARIRTGLRISALFLVTIASVNSFRYYEYAMALFAEIIGGYIAARSKRFWAWHRRLRALALTANSYGCTVSIGEILLADVIATCELDKLFALPPRPSTNLYYSSHAAPGPKRLIENVRESAFYTNRLLREFSYSIVWAPFTVGLIAIVVVFLLPYIGIESPLTLALLVALTALSLLDSLQDHAESRFYSRNIAAVHDECTRCLEDPNPSIEKATSLFSDYVTISQAAPAVPTKLYAARRDGLKYIRHG